MNDADLILPIDVADGVLNRIDRIVLRLDIEGRAINAVVKKGTFASSPVAPDLQRDADAYELGIADILVSAGAVSVTQANITDLRLNNELCGIVHGTVEQVDTTTLFNQYLTWLQEKKTQYDNDMINWTSQKQAEFEDWATAQEQDFNNWRIQEEQNFNTWFASIEDILDENVATNLLNMIGDLESLETDDKSSLVNAINEVDAKGVDLADDLAAHKAENVQQFDEIYSRLNGLKSNDIQARREILDIKLKLDEMKVVDYLNKTGIGFYDLFENTEYIDITNTTATVDTTSADVVFTGQESLKMLPQKFDESINNIELAIYDIDRESYQVDNSVSNSTQIQITIQPGKINVGDKYYYNGEVYEVTGVSEA
ncbi:hypothetical protein [Clostridium sp.]|uniref:hypothetical protein n=1 Tax=Clostridium sp. TaxID=1506 RepID=UPI003A5C580E